MKKSIAYFLRIYFSLFIVVCITSCSVVEYMKKNCSIQTEVGSLSYICVTCNLSNADDQLKKKVENRIKSKSLSTIVEPKVTEK